MSCVPIGSGRPFSMACRKMKLRRMCRSRDSRNAWPLLSSRLKRLVRQKPFSRCRRATGRQDSWPRRASAACAATASGSCRARSAGSVKSIDGLHDIVGEQARVLVFGVLLVDLELHRLGTRVGKYDRVPSANSRYLRFTVGSSLGVVLLDKAACAADKIQPHQVAPIVGIFALLEGGQRTNGALVTADEFRFAQLPKSFSGRIPMSLSSVNEQPKLVRQVEIGLVVGVAERRMRGCRSR